MTWPFENDTSAIVKKLAGRSMQADKRNKAFLLLTIAISVCMVFSILLISTGTQEKFKNTQRNKAQIGILGVTDEQTAQLHQNENITWVGEYSAIGVFYVENKTITVAYGNEDYFLHQEEKTFQGSVPQKADEIMLPQNYLDFLGKSYQTGDTISIDLTGTGQKAEYTLSGVLNNTKESNGYFIYVSKELAQDLAKDSFQVTAYTRLNTDAISSTAILNFAGKAIQNTGIVEEQVMLTEYSAVMSGVITSGIPIPVPLLAALTAILAATIVYGVFYTKIVKNVQMFGQLRTVGMTKRQIKRMASKEGRLYALAGIPLGLVIGVLIGFIGCPDGFRLKTTVIYAVLIAAVAFVTVNIAIFKPVRVAMNTSPVEGAKYLAYAGKAKSSSKLHRKLTPFNLAKINIQRNKQKAVLTLLMLGVSGALLLVTSTVAGSIDPAKQASFKYYPAGNILIQIRNTVGSSFDNEAEPYGSAKLQLEENPLEDQALMQELEKVDGIEKITAFDSVYMTATFSGESGSITSISDFFPTLNREQTEEKQAALSSGTADYDDMVEKNGILVAEDIAQVGDTLKIEGRAFDGRTFDVEAVVVGTYNRSDLMEDSPVVPGSPYFIMTYDTAKKLTGITEQTGILAIKNSEGCFDEVLTAVQKIADQGGNAMRLKDNTNPFIHVNPPYQLMVIHSSKLVYPRELYQRGVERKRVELIAAHFNEYVANEPKVSFRNGQFIVTDGQHTIEGRILRNGGKDLPILCKVYTGMTVEQEALLFAEQNGFSAPLTAGIKLRAKVVGGDAISKAFLAATNRVGLSLNYDSQQLTDYRIGCVGTAFRLYKQMGEPLYCETMRLIVAAWEGKPDSFRASVLKGMMHFVELYHGEFSEERLLRALRNIHPVDIYRIGQDDPAKLRGWKKYVFPIYTAYNGKCRKDALPMKF